MLRVIGGSANQAVPDKATRIENRIGEPAADPYLYIASQIYAGMDGVRAQMQAPQASVAPYAFNDKPLPGSLKTALEMLNNDVALGAAFGSDFIAYFTHVKTSELKRYELAEDKDEWQRREYFGRI